MSEYESGSERLKRKVIEARKVIKKKFSLAKFGKEETDRSYRTKHKPIINPLESILSTLTSSSSSPSAASKKDNIIIKKEEKVEDEGDDDEEVEGVDDEDRPLQTTYHALPDIYVRKLIADIDPNLDKGRYGISYNYRNDRWKIGGSRVIIDGKDLIIKNNRFEGTSGLYDLLTCKKLHRDNLPNRSDIKNYRQIILLTNAHRRLYSPRGKLIPAKHDKFRQILEPYFNRLKRTASQQHVGSNLTFKKLNRKPIEYVYWNKPAELVARLRLLLASQQAGNNSCGNRNEILSIISELREDKIIK